MIIKGGHHTAQHCENISNALRGKKGYSNKPEDVWKHINQVFPELCWEWTGSTCRGNYGEMNINWVKYKVHRIVYELIYGPIPEGLFVMHQCNNPLCCNPNHLKLGTQKDNMEYKVLCCRQPMEKNVHNCKLTNDQILEIRQRYINGECNQSKLAKEYGVVHQHMSRIINKLRRDKI